MNAATTSPAPRPLAHRIGEQLLPHLAVVTALVAPLTVWSRLPDPVASHWSTAGPDGSLGRLTHLILLTLVTALVAYGPVAAARFPMPRPQAQLLIAAAGFGSALLAGVQVLAVRANLDVTSWEQADALPGVGVVAVVGLAGLAALLGWSAAASRSDLPPRTSSVPQAITVAPGEAVVWTGGASGPVAVGVALTLLGAAAIGAVFAPPEPRLIVVTMLPVVALAVAALGQVRVTVGPRGVTVSFGWLGWPRLRVPIEDVRQVEVEDVLPASYGGWGYRQVPGTTAIVVRSGEGLRITRRSGRTFVVTVDDAARAAGVLLAHRDARAVASE